MTREEKRQKRQSIELALTWRLRCSTPLLEQIVATKKERLEIQKLHRNLLGQAFWLLLHRMLRPIGFHGALSVPLPFK